MNTSTKSNDQLKSSHEFSTNSALTSVCYCHRTYDPGAGGLSAFGGPSRGVEAWSKGETYSCVSSVAGWVKVEDNSGVIHELPNAAFDSYFRWL